ncbi:MAG: LON peptidase substrate-binding domain-containing protein, partial [Gammaproteobacteria bacterium]|nr:LON peptidase substrate-binding domain-containing protein [Gammaproteobacteria bacterium]
MTWQTIPLFPLGTVLFPDGPLPLRIFEPRYLDMISRCLRQDSEFGVVLIVNGQDTGQVETTDVGTLARVVDWYQGSDGILGITARGTRQFRLHGVTRQADGLYLGDVELLPEIPPRPLPEEFRPLATLLASVIDDLGR